MLTSAPWITGADPIRAMTAGGDLGLGASRLNLDASRAAAELGLQGSALNQSSARIRQAQDEATNRIRLAYAELGQRANEGEANRALHGQQVAAELAASAQQHGLENLFRDRARATEEERTKLMEQKFASDQAANALDPEKKLIHVGQGVYRYNPLTGKLDTLILPPQQMDPYQRTKLGNLYGRQRDAMKAALSTTDPKTQAAALAEAKSVDAQIRKITGEPPPDAESPGPDQDTGADLANPPQTASDRLGGIWSGVKNALGFGPTATPNLTAPTDVGGLGPMTMPPVTNPPISPQGLLQMNAQDSPNPPGVVNPYKVGGNYGGMRYKGGDFTDEDNWESVDQ